MSKSSDKASLKLALLHAGEDALLHLDEDEPVRVLPDESDFFSDKLGSFEMDRDSTVVICDPAEVNKTHEGKKLTFNATRFVIDRVRVEHGESEVSLLPC